MYVSTVRRGRFVSILLCVREVPGSNIGQKTCHSHSDFSWLTSVPPDKCRDDTFNKVTTDQLLRFYIASNERMIGE